MNHHDPGPTCPSCEKKLEEAHPYMASWFHDIKKDIPMIHISWSYRDGPSQELAFKQGKTKLHFPLSKHNFIKIGKPCSLALDLFVLSVEGIAQFPQLTYAKINAYNESKSLPINWGGKWKSIGDSDHFEFSGSV